MLRFIKLPDELTGQEEDGQNLLRQAVTLECPGVETCALGKKPHGGSVIARSGCVGVGVGEAFPGNPFTQKTQKISTKSRRTTCAFDPTAVALVRGVRSQVLAMAVSPQRS